MVEKTPEKWREEWTRTGQVELSAFGPSREALEAILRLDPTGLELVKEFLVIENTTNILELINMLMPHRHKLRKVVHAVGYSLSSETADAFMTLLKDITTLEQLQLLGTTYRGPPMVFPRALNDSSLWPELRAISLQSIVMTEHVMQAWCKSLLDRQHLVESLVLYVENWQKDAWPIFIDAIPRLRLKRLDLADIDQDEILDVCERLDQCDTLEGFALYTSASRDPLITTDRLIKSIDRAVRQMPLLMSLAITQFGELTREQLVGLGRVVASRPSLRAALLILSQWLADSDVKEFLLACGNHPNLKEVRFSTSAPIPQLLQSHIAVSQSWHARCLVILIAGATIERVGRNSSLWKVKQDVFRHLLTFLPK